MFPLKTLAVPGWFEEYENEVKSYDMTFTVIRFQLNEIIKYRRFCWTAPSFTHLNIIT